MLKIEQAARAGIMSRPGSLVCVALCCMTLSLAAGLGTHNRLEINTAEVMCTKMKIPINANATKYIDVCSKDNTLNYTDYKRPSGCMYSACYNGRYTSSDECTAIWDFDIQFGECYWLCAGMLTKTSAPCTARAANCCVGYGCNPSCP